jgi:hypothetical protein
MADTPSFKHRHTVKNTKHTDISIDPQQLAAMASNKSIASPGLLLFLAMALVLTATSVRAQSPSPTPAPPAPTTLPPAAAPSQNPCPSGFNNTVAFAQGVRAYLLRGISLIFSPVKVTPGTSTTRCFCYYSTNITIPVAFFPLMHCGAQPQWPPRMRARPPNMMSTPETQHAGTHSYYILHIHIYIYTYE